MKPINVGRGGSPTTIRLRNPANPQLVLSGELVKVLLGRSLNEAEDLFVVPYTDNGDLVLFEIGQAAKSRIGAFGNPLKAWRSNPLSKTLYVSAVSILHALGLEFSQWPEEGYQASSPSRGKLVVHIKRRKKC